MSKFDNILFDLDGTISDSYEGITKSIVYALERLGIAPPDDRQALRMFIGPSLWESFSKHYGLDNDGAALAVKYYRENYNNGGMFDCTIYDGVEDMLKSLYESGKKLILATSKPEVAAVKIMEHFGLDKYFRFMAGASSDKSRVEKSDVIAYAVKHTGIDVSRSVMVGDRKHDVDGARKNGIKCIGVLYGFGSEQELIEAKAEYISATPKGVTEIIRNS